MVGGVGRARAQAGWRVGGRGYGRDGASGCARGSPGGEGWQVATQLVTGARAQHTWGTALTLRAMEGCPQSRDAFSALRSVWLNCSAVRMAARPRCTSPAEYERSVRFCSGPAQTAGARGA